MEQYDMHVHSRFSFDGKDELPKECAAARERGIAGLCFTEHFSVDPADVSYGVRDVLASCQQVQRCRKIYGISLWIGFGLEIGEPQLAQYSNDLAAALRKVPLDYIIGSVHNICSRKLRLFMQEKTKAEVYATYFNEVLSMVQTARIDVVGHLDLMKRYAFSLFGNYSFADYENVLTQILQCVISRGIGIEINTSGWRNAVQEPYPSREVLQLYKRLGGIYITIGSDAHTAEHLATDFLRAQEILRQCGFTEIYYYEKHIPKAVSLLE